MFCPSCGKQNKDNEVFCAFCGKVLSQKSTLKPSVQPALKANPRQKDSVPKARISFTAVKAIVTGLLIIGLIMIVLQIYYPAVLPWNW
jgi:uncharacterized membrane protein YvbJ